MDDRLPIRIWRDADVSAAHVELRVGVVRLEEAVDATVITRRTEARRVARGCLPAQAVGQHLVKVARAGVVAARAEQRDRVVVAHNSDHQFRRVRVYAANDGLGAETTHAGLGS